MYHAGYGCETGCCGHVVELEDGRNRFEFEHPYDVDRRAWARELAEEVIRKHWPECLDTIAWESLEIDDISGD